MSTVTSLLSQSAVIKYLVARKFPLAQSFRASRGIGSNFTASPSDPGAYERRAEILASADAYENELRTKPWAELQALHREEKEAEQAALRAKMEQEERERFFNQPYATADLDHWSRAAHWTLDEAVALSLGKAPEIVNSKSVMPHSNVSPFTKRYARLRDLAARAVPWKQLYDPVLPGIFLGWARQNEISYPEELERLVRARGHHIANWKTLYDDLKSTYDDLKSTHDDHTSKAQELADQVQELAKTAKDFDAHYVAELEKAVDDYNALLGKFNASERELKELKERVETSPSPDLVPRERNNLLRLVIAMAAKKYGFDPRKSKNSATQNIVATMEEMGVKLGEDTVLKYLREAGELIDWSEFDERRKS